jgi:hypothetical protein
MTLASKTFVLAIALAAAPAATRADDALHRGDRGDRRDDRSSDRDDRNSDRYAPPAPQPYRGDVRADRDGSFDREWRDDARNDRDDRFSRWSGYDRWSESTRRPAATPYRYAEWRELRQEFWQLENARDQFYASGRHDRGEVRRFERWYAWRRNELERRRDALVLRYHPSAGAYARR